MSCFCLAHWDELVISFNCKHKLYSVHQTPSITVCVSHRGPPRPRPVRDGEEDKENQSESGQSQEPRQRRYRRNFNYRRRRPQTTKPQDGKDSKAGDASAEKSAAPEAEQGGAD